MKESTVYQAAVAEGEARGQSLGSKAEARRLLLRAGRKRFGEPPAAVLAAIDAIDDLERLEILAVRVLDATNWTDVIDG